MAKLSDLSDELLQRIITHIGPVPWYPEQSGQHKHQLMDNRMGTSIFAERTRPHEALIHQPGGGHTWYLSQDTDHPDPSQVSWPEGLPQNKLVPLALINRSFRRCAQPRLFENVTLRSQWQACLFLQKLREGVLKIGSSSETNPPCLSPLAQHVRSLLFQDRAWRPPCSMGMGGGSLICELIRSCPLLENVAINIRFYNRCKDPILEALASRPCIKDFVLLEEAAGHTHHDFEEVKCLADEIVVRLFSKWSVLETVELHSLSGRPVEMIKPIHASITLPNCPLHTIILTEPDLDKKELALILKSAGESLRTLKISRPSSKLDRPGLCWILKECTGPGLESLTVAIARSWHIIRSSDNDELSEDPAKNRGLFEIVFKTSLALKNLKSLSIEGRLTNSALFASLPPSIMKLRWGGCHLTPAGFAQALSSWSNYPPDQPAGGHDKYIPWLPNLKCCTIMGDGNWDNEERSAIHVLLEERRACFHREVQDTSSFDSENDEMASWEDDNYECCC
ncbi:hypothetical protein PtA15_5A75 [Puccinia triticina]|uniref:F-box domain-containing protein n=1 Tax=Puccinia triticina TaxID=208348 RepID=A0ABY7CHD0_9BASI|nr:uncharacterized protein PtA15_5A75 [Puccinia triticina]WAQ84505.1 hypothetical protein PtA15_5A75 [Puccinia triticina]WAR57845.1 hypothetical protein PtB15_5B75 [Puccinia triticina]